MVDFQRMEEFVSYLPPSFLTKMLNFRAFYIDLSRKSIKIILLKMTLLMFETHGLVAVVVLGEEYK